jgi:hypothetical protein
MPCERDSGACSCTVGFFRHLCTCNTRCIPVILPRGRLNLPLLRPSPVLPKKIKISRLFKISAKKKNLSAIFFGFPYVDQENPRDYRKCHFLLLIFCQGHCKQNLTGNVR